MSDTGTASTRRKIMFLTATRADFGKLKTLIERVRDSKEFDYSIFATGMHMLSRYGSTVKEIYRSGFENIIPYVNQDGTVNSQMDLVLADTVRGLGLHIREACPDLLVIHGDRVETLAGAIVGALNNIRVAHIEGGELSGTVDEILRHAVSKLSHIHFVANEEAAGRLLQMGEERRTIFVIGSPDIDIMLSDRLPSLGEVKNHYGIDFERYGVFLYHPVTTELSRIQQHARETIDAMLESGLNFVVVEPNNDRGAELIHLELQQLRGNSRFRILPSLRFESFIVLMRHADVVMGNSSAGVREAPALGVPTINLGSRQRSRFKHRSILDIAEKRSAILEALRSLPAQLSPIHHFGAGNSAELFMDALSSGRVWDCPTQKLFRDLDKVVSVETS